MLYFGCRIDTSSCGTRVTHGPSRGLRRRSHGRTSRPRESLHNHITRQHPCMPDNTAAMSSFKGKPAESSQAVFLRFRELTQAHGRVTIQWCPGHQDIEGNELADRVAKTACQQGPLPQSMPALAAVQRRMKEENRQLPLM